MFSSMGLFGITVTVWRGGTGGPRNYSRRASQGQTSKTEVGPRGPFSSETGHCAFESGSGMQGV